MDFDTVIHGGTIATPSETWTGDIGIRDGRIAVLSDRVAGGDGRIDARGRIVVPGGIEGHAHIAQESSAGLMTADDYHTGSVSAAFGGNTSFIPFAAQHRGESIDQVIRTYDDRAASNSVIDYSYHLIISDPTPSVLGDELPRAFARGITSFKVFMTYDLMNLGDRGMLDILTVARQHGALTMVHAENNDMIKWMNARLAAAGLTAPRYHAVSRPALAEAEAINRAIALARLVGAGLFVVHVSTPEGAELVARARAEGLPIHAETCPQYLALTRADLDRPGMEGAKYICSPPLRDATTRAALWRHARAGTFESVSSDHAPYRFDASGKFAKGPKPAYPAIANGMPGIAARLPYLFSEGVIAGRITLQQFVALSSSNAARVFGMDRKGAILPGFDADIVLWDPEATRTVTVADQHDAMDYTPFEGMRLTGWPTHVLSRGEVIVEAGELKAARGRGRFVARKPYRPDPNAPVVPEMDPALNFGAELRP
jgi:dihydropyrimidinase